MRNDPEWVLCPMDFSPDESATPTKLDEIEHLWVLEATRRLEEIESGKVKAIPGDEVLAEVRRVVGG